MNKFFIIIILLLLGISCNHNNSIDPYEIILKMFEQDSDLNMNDRSFHYYGYRYINTPEIICSLEMWSYNKRSRIEEVCDDKEFIIISNDIINVDNDNGILKK